MKTITYVCPAPDRATGGIKTIYRHCALLNRHFAPDVRAQVHHPQDPDYRPDWFEHETPVKQDRAWAVASELAILPEIWACPLAAQYRSSGVRYGLFVQNGYSINWHGSYDELAAAYAGAAVILTVSEDTTRCIETAFPDAAARIVELQCSVDATRFRADAPKESLITYMPRKLASHAALVLFFLTPYLPRNWSVLAIDGVDEAEVAGRLNRSRIFLSFAEAEGLSLPPIEAALAGNHVIGYTGEGAKEYWDRALFTEIANGDIRAFVAAIRERIAGFAADAVDAAPARAARERIRARYSEAAELARIKVFVERLPALFA